MLKGINLCFYGRSDEKIDDVQLYFEYCLDRMPSWICAFDMRDVYIDNGVLAVKKHRKKFESMMEKIHSGEYNFVIIPSLEDIAEDRNILGAIFMDIYFSGAQVYSIQNKSIINPDDILHDIVSSHRRAKKICEGN